MCSRTASIRRRPSASTRHPPSRMASAPMSWGHPWLRAKRTSGPPRPSVRSGSIHAQPPQLRPVATKSRSIAFSHTSAPKPSATAWSNHERIRNRTGEAKDPPLGDRWPCPTTTLRDPLRRPGSADAWRTRPQRRKARPRGQRQTRRSLRSGPGVRPARERLRSIGAAASVGRRRQRRRSGAITRRDGATFWRR